MKRKFLFSFYETPQGRLLRVLEKNYLKHSITVGCKQAILQIGALGWETDFIDCSLYQKYSIVDIRSEGSCEAINIRARSFKLPIQSETVDLVIVPHLLEFDSNRFQTMREIERVLKPGGEVIILNFNSLNIWVRLQSLWDKRLSSSWLGNFIPRSRISDWLKLLSFEVTTTSEFTLDSILTTPGRFKLGRRTFFARAYAVRAIKRKYTLIPLSPINSESSRLVTTTAAGLKSATHRKKKHG